MLVLLNLFEICTCFSNVLLSGIGAKVPLPAAFSFPPSWEEEHHHLLIFGEVLFSHDALQELARLERVFGRHVPPS